MAKIKKQLLITIEQNGTVFHQHLTNSGRFHIGKHPENDVVVYGDHFPKKHTLISGKNNRFHINFKRYMKGEVAVHNSRLTFYDMIVHNLLLLKGDNFYYPLTPEKEGFIVVGNAKISFRFVEKERMDIKAEKTADKFSGFSWSYAFIKDLGRDLSFKVIFLVVTVVHVFLLNYMSNLPAGIEPKATINRVPERFAKFIVKNPAKSSTMKGTEFNSVESRNEPGEEAKESRAETESKPSRPEAQGVLGLLTGKGSSNQSSSLVDFLLDKGLVKELDEVMSSSDLQLGKGQSDGGFDIDNLIATNEVTGGIDDILGDVDEVESVELGEKGQIQLEQVENMTGTQEALGQRSEESVRSVMLSHTGRLTYIYNKYLKREPTLQGKLVVEVVIAADGSVQSVKKITSTMNNQEFDREVINFIRRWKYEPINAGTVTVSYPLFFNKVD